MHSVQLVLVNLVETQFLLLAVDSLLEVLLDAELLLKTLSCQNTCTFRTFSVIFRILIIIRIISYKHRQIYVVGGTEMDLFKHYCLPVTLAKQMKLSIVEDKLKIKSLK